jgi:hypothetical protein
MNVTVIGFCTTFGRLLITVHGGSSKVPVPTLELDMLTGNMKQKAIPESSVEVTVAFSHLFPRLSFFISPFLEN